LGKVTDTQPKRAVSLIASATEIVCALGACDLLVGRSHECDFPRDVTRLPSLTEPKFPVSGTSYDIDARVFHPELFTSRYKGKGWTRYARQRS
jgi:hypothetical protein